MTTEEFRKLKPGDIVRSAHSGYGFIVMANYGDRVTAATTVDMSNPIEWLLVRSDQGEPICGECRAGVHYFEMNGDGATCGHRIRCACEHRRQR